MTAMRTLASQDWSKGACHYAAATKNGNLGDGGVVSNGVLREHICAALFPLPITP